MKPSFYTLREATWVARPRKEDQWDELRDTYREMQWLIESIEEEEAKLVLRNRMQDFARIFGNIKKLTTFD